MPCPNCGQYNEAGATVCPRCGQALTADIDPSQTLIRGIPSSQGYAPTPTPPYPAPMAQPYAPPPSQPYAPPPSQPYGSPPPSQPYAAPPSQPYGSPPQPTYAPPPSQPYGPLPSQPYGPPPSQPYGSPPQPTYSPPPSQPYGPPPSQPYAPPSFTPPGQPGQIMPGIFGPSYAVGAVPPTNAVQRFLAKNLPQAATNPIIGALIGGAVAIIACIVLSFASLIALGKVVDALFGTSGASSGSAQTSYTDLAKNIMTVVALEHHATLVLVSGGQTAFSLDIPLTVLTLVPFVSAVLGGYFAAATDYTNELRYAAGRAAAAGLVYGVLITILTVLFGTQSFSVAGTSNSFGPTLFPQMLYAVAIGVLGALVGGAWKVYGGRWRAGTVAHALSKPRLPVVAGAVGGALAVGLGLLLSLAVVAFLGGVSYGDTQFTNTLLGPNLLSGSLASETGIIPLGAPFLAVWVLSLASGGSLSVSGGFSLLGSSSSGSSSVNLLSSGVNHWLLLLALLPIAAYYYGGRVAARLTGTLDQSARLTAGAVVGVTGALIMTILALVTRLALTLGGGALGGNVDLGPNYGGAFLGTLIFGLIFALLGALLYRPPVAAPAALPLDRAFGALDRLTAQPAELPRSPARRWLYATVIAGLALAAVGVLLDIANVGLAGALPFASYQNFVQYATGAILGVVTLLGAIALATDLASLPPGFARAPVAASPPPPSYAGLPQYPPSQPYPPAMFPPSAPYPGQPQYPPSQPYPPAGMPPSQPYPSQMPYPPQQPPVGIPPSQPYPGQPQYPPQMPYPPPSGYPPPAGNPPPAGYPPSAPYPPPYPPQS